MPTRRHKPIKKPPATVRPPKVEYAPPKKPPAKTKERVVVSKDYLLVLECCADLLVDMYNDHGKTISFGTWEINQTRKLVNRFRKADRMSLPLSVSLADFADLAR